MISDKQLMKIRDLGRVITGKTPPTVRVEFFGTDFPFITPTDIKSFDVRYLSQTERYLSRQGYEFQKRYLLHRNTVCYVCIGSTIGKMCLVERESFTNQQINSIVVDEKQYNPIYVFYLLRTITPRIQAISGGSGAGKAILNKTSFEDIEIEVHSRPIQDKIAAILSAYDDLIENNTRRIKILEEMAQMIYREWFVHFRFPGHEKVKMVDSPLGKIPEGWELKKTKDILKRLKAGTVYTETNVYETGCVPVIDQSRDSFLGFHDNEPDHLASSENPIIIFGDHTCKMQVMVEPFSVGPNVVPFVAENEVPILYLYFLVRNLVETKEYKRHWTELVIKKVVVAVNEHSRRFTSYIKPTFEQTNSLMRKNQILRRTRDLLLPKLISGEVEVETIEFNADKTNKL